MIRFHIDGDSAPRGIRLVGEAEHQDDGGSIRSAVLDTPHKAALQARELADAAAALIEGVPEFEAAFEHLHDALSALPAA